MCAPISGAGALQPELEVLEWRRGLTKIVYVRGWVAFLGFSSVPTRRWAAIAVSDGEAKARLRDFLDKRAAKALHRSVAAE